VGPDRRPGVRRLTLADDVEGVLISLVYTLIIGATLLVLGLRSIRGLNL
jgi:hypothetical protein